ncbi:MAG TPA: superoxide dismutase family protein [Phenylobacterium sp.]|nr:superoxide dismutase family protein [Phenylobacterium sp.]
MRYVVAALIATLSAAPAFGADAPAIVRIDLKNSAGASVGQATLTQATSGVLARIEVKGLTPGWHGLHFHETGDCSKSDFTSAGGHVHAMATKVHGLLNPDLNEAGDLPNLFVAADGSGTVELLSTFVSLRGPGPRPALADKDGSALVIHAGPDDYISQPIGGAGARTACGVIPAG